jgi:hypothetical protein
MKYQKVQRAFYDIVEEVRKPDELFSHRGFLAGFFARAISAAALGRRVPEYAVTAALVTYVLIANYVVAKPTVSFPRYLLRTAVFSAALLLLWLCLRQLAA